MIMMDRLSRRRAEYWVDRPDPLTHMEFARTLTVPDSQDERGRLEPYEPTTHPGQFHMLAALDGAYAPPGSRFLRFVLQTDTQDGKSWLLQQCAFRDMVEMGQSVIYAIPTRDLGGDIWSLKLRPAIDGAGLAQYLPEQGPGSRDGSKPRFIPFRRRNGKGGGTLVFMAAGGRGQSGQAALTARKLLVDEVDDWEEAALYRIQRRVDKNNQTALQLYASTVKKDDAPGRENDHSNICAIYERSTRGRVEYQCPHCLDFTPYEWAGFKYEGTTAAELKASARVHCAKCGAAINDAQRSQSFGVHRLAMAAPGAETFGLRYTALDCPWKPLGWLASIHYGATLDLDRANHEPMRQFAHDQRAEQYREDVSGDDMPAEIDPPYLFRRSQASKWGPAAIVTDRAEGIKPTYSRHVAPMPAAAEWATVAIDVQANRCYWLLLCGDSKGRTYHTAWGYEQASRDGMEMDRLGLHSVLDRIASVVDELAGDALRIVMRGVDANYRTDDVIAWLRTHPDWLPLYGASAKKAAKMKGKEGDRVGDFPGVLYLRRSKTWPLRQDRVHIDTNPMRHAAQRSLLLTPDEAGAALLPNGLTSSASDRAYLNHLCAERWDSTKLLWQPAPSGGRWDWLDCATYCTALHRFHLLRTARPRVKKRTGILGRMG